MSASVPAPPGRATVAEALRDHMAASAETALASLAEGVAGND
ncbi:hypothetical protein [Lentzea jiangxiensis]|nr:hypothetical protein [Lentzea jiangxiensis]